MMLVVTSFAPPPCPSYRLRRKPRRVRAAFIGRKFALPREINGFTVVARASLLKHRVCPSPRVSTFFRRKVVRSNEKRSIFPALKFRGARSSAKCFFARSHGAHKVASTKMRSVLVTVKTRGDIFTSTFIHALIPSNIRNICKHAGASRNADIYNEINGQKIRKAK